MKEKTEKSKNKPRHKRTNKGRNGLHVHGRTDQRMYERTNAWKNRLAYGKSDKYREVLTDVWTNTRMNGLTQGRSTNWFTDVTNKAVARPLGEIDCFV